MRNLKTTLFVAFLLFPLQVFTESNNSISWSGYLETYYAYDFGNPDNGVIVGTGSPNGFKVSGYSMNLDYAPTDHVLLRIEGRGFHSKDKIFNRNGEPFSDDFAITRCMAISF